MSDNLSDAQKEQHFNFLIVNSKIDALTVMVEDLHVKNGSTRDEFRKALKKWKNACEQKYLEKIQEKFPRLASEIDLRAKVPEIDQNLLDGLKFDDEPEQGLG